jgi:hypothetical protein
MASTSTILGAPGSSTMLQWNAFRLMIHTAVHHSTTAPGELLPHFLHEDGAPPVVPPLLLAPVPPELDNANQAVNQLNLASHKFYYERYAEQAHAIQGIATLIRSHCTPDILEQLAVDLGGPDQALVATPMQQMTALRLRHGTATFLQVAAVATEVAAMRLQYVDTTSLRKFCSTQENIFLFLAGNGSPHSQHSQISKNCYQIFHLLAPLRRCHRRFRPQTLSGGCSAHLSGTLQLPVYSQ